MNKQQYIWLFFILLATLSAIFAFDFYSQSKWINFVLFSAMTIVCVILAQVLALSFIQKSEKILLAIQKKDFSLLPGYKVNEYKIVLVPHDDLIKHIQEVRKVFNDKLSIESPNTSIPQVLLASFKQIEAAESRILNRLKLVAMANPAFKVELKDFGSFPSHTIFINVTSKVPVGNLIKKIKTDGQRLMKLDADNKPYFPTDSHITIGLKLKPWQYEKAWLEYEKKHFTGRFIADHMLLLRRREGEFKYKIAESFRFENMPVDIKQGELF